MFQSKSKSDLDKSAKITKLRLQYEYELNTFCKEDQKDLVCYLQRQLLARDQRIAEQSFDIEQFKSFNSINDNNAITNKKTKAIQILRSSDPDLVLSTVSRKKTVFFLFLRVLRFIRHYMDKLPCNVLLPLLIHR